MLRTRSSPWAPAAQKVHRNSLMLMSMATSPSRHMAAMPMCTPTRHVAFIWVPTETELTLPTATRTSMRCTSVRSCHTGRSDTLLKLCCRNPSYSSLRECARSLERWKACPVREGDDVQRRGVEGLAQAGKREEAVLHGGAVDAIPPAYAGTETDRRGGSPWGPRGRACRPVG